MVEKFWVFSNTPKFREVNIVGVGLWIYKSSNWHNQLFWAENGEILKVFAEQSFETEFMDG